MTLPFSQYLNGKPTYFPEKIIAGFPEDSDYNNMFVWSELNIAKAPRGEGVGIVSCQPLMDFVPKLHTIREDKADRWKPGMKIHAVINNRTKNRYQFVPVMECVSVQKIEIEWWYPGEVYVKIDGKELDDIETKLLARNDGFDSEEEFFAYFNRDFTGKIIHWTDLRY